MAPDPKQEADAYMQKHQLGHLFEDTGPEPVLSRDELGAMFRLFDVTTKGSVTVEQANAGLKTLLGQEADLRKIEPNLYLNEKLRREKFIDYMQQAMQTTPKATAAQ
eukprot:jgi/Astpho2/8610/fgenesh1_pg.00126_%23_25_t